MRAYIIVSASNLDSGSDVFKIFETIQEIPEVEFASIVYGDAEIVAALQADSEASMSRIIADKLRRLPGVTGTKTYIGVHGYYYNGDERRTANARKERA